MAQRIMSNTSIDQHLFYKSKDPLNQYKFSLKSNNDSRAIFVKLLDAQDALLELEQQNIRLKRSLNMVLEQLILTQTELSKKTEIISGSQKESHKVILLFKQLMLAQQELERLNNKINNLETLPTSKPLRNTVKSYGAAEAVKAGLPYRVGHHIVNAKTPSKVLSLPLNLFNEYKSSRSTGTTYLNERVVYLDEQKAEKVKNHLSYRIGKEVVESANSPMRLAKLPVSLSKIILEFKKNSDK